MSSLVKSLFLAAASATTALAITGDLTYYKIGLGACGWTNNDDEMVVAMNHGQFGYDVNPNNAAICGKWIIITKDNTKVRAKVVDKCPDGGCVNGNIDASPAVFKQFAPLDVGRIQISWEFEDGTGGGSPNPAPSSAAPAPSSEPAPAPSSQAPAPVPTTSEPAPVPTTSEVVVSSSSSEVVIPSTTLATVVRPSTTSTSTTSISTTSTTEAAATTTSKLPGGNFKENRVHVVVVTQWVTSYVTAVPTA